MAVTGQLYLLVSGICVRAAVYCSKTVRAGHSDGQTRSTAVVTVVNLHDESTIFFVISYNTRDE
jgi:hypothetical protein